MLFHARADRACHLDGVSFGSLPVLNAESGNSARHLVRASGFSTQYIE